MEQMLSKFNAFGEVQSDLRDRVGKIETDLHTVKEDVGVLKAAARTQGADIHAIKSDVAEMKANLKSYNQRLEVVETKVAS